MLIRTITNGSERKLRRLLDPISSKEGREGQIIVYLDNRHRSKDNPLNRYSVPTFFVIEEKEEAESSTPHYIIRDTEGNRIRIAGEAYDFFDAQEWIDLFLTNRDMPDFRYR